MTAGRAGAEPRPLTGDVVALGLDAGGEVGVLGDGVAVVVQRGELTGDLRVPRNQHRRQHCGGRTDSVTFHTGSTS